MAATYAIEEIDDDARWDELVRQGVGGTIFASSAWLHCAQEALAAPVKRWGCVGNGRLVAGTSGVVRHRAGLRHFTTPELTPHGGLVCLPPASASPARVESEQHRTAMLLFDHLEAEYAHVHLTHGPDLIDMRPLVWSGHRVQVRYTYRIPLDSAEGLWQRLERRTRTVVRKAVNGGWQVRPTADVALFEDLYARIYRKRGQTPPVAAATAARFVHHVLAAGLGRAVSVVSPAGECASVVVFIENEDLLYAWVSGAEPVHGPSGAVSLLYLRTLEQSDARVFDFVGANLPSIARFKRGFGGHLLPYYTSEYFARRVLRVLVPLWRAWRADAI